MTDPLAIANVDELLRQRTWLREFARRLVDDPAGADDLAQSTLMAALEAKAPKIASPRGFLATIARRLALRRIRATSRREKRERAVVDAQSNEVPSTDELVAEAEVQQTVVRTLLELEEPYRTTLLLKFFRELSVAEIATAQGIPAATVDTRLRRGLERMRRALDGRCGSRAAWIVPLIPRSTPLAATAIAGGVAMSLMQKSILAVAVVGLVAYGVLQHADDSGEAAEILVAEAPTRPPSPSPIATESGQREPVAPPSVAATLESGAIVSIVDEHDRPLCGHVVFERAGELESEETDLSGQVSFAPSAEEVDVLILAKGRVPQIERRALTAGEHRFVLRDGGVLSLRVRVDGEPAPAGIDFGFDWSGGADPAANVSPRYRILMRATSLEATTDAQGRVMFAGLPPEARGSVRLADSGFRLLATGTPVDSLAIERLTTDLAIELEALPRVTGRVLDASGAPCDAKILIEVDGQTQSSQVRTRTRPDGGFGRSSTDLAIGRSLRVIAIDHATGKRALSVPTTMTTKRLDVGDLVMNDGQSFAFRLLDESRQPLAGGVAFDPEVAIASAPTDLEGRGRFHSYEPAQSVGFTAPGCEIVVQPVAVAAMEECEVILRRAAELRFTHPDGTPWQGPGTLEVTCAVDPRAAPAEFSFAPASHYLLESVPTSYSFDMSETGGAMRLRLETTAGEMHLPRIRPGIRFGFVLRDEGDHELAAGSDLELLPGEVRSIVVTKSSATGTLRVRVVDPSNQPIGYVLLQVTEASGASRSQVCSEDGIAELTGLEGGPLEIEALVPAFAPVLRTGIDPAVTGPEFVLTLRPARVLEVEIVDEFGTGYIGLEPEAFADSKEAESYFVRRATERGAGLYVFEELPPERPIPLSVGCNGEKHAMVHDSPDNRVRWVIRRSKR